MKKMCLAILCLISLSCFSQNIYIFKGELKSRSRKEEVPYAAVSIPSRRMGVVANDKGQFELHISSDYWTDSVQIQAMGFSTYTARIQDLVKNAYHTIFLTDTIVPMAEVVVSSLEAREMVLRAYQRADSNFQNTPYEMDVFYRSTIKENGTYVKLLESLFKAHDRGFNYKRIAQSVEVGNEIVRTSVDYTNPKAKLPYPFFKPQWLLTADNHARNRPDIVKNIKEGNYEMEYETPKYLGGKLIYVITATPKDKARKFIWDIKFFIREKDYAIMQVDFDGKSRIDRVPVSGIPGGLRIAITEFKNTYVFKEHDGKMYMHYLNNFIGYQWYGSSSGKLLSSCEENSQAIIQHVYFPPGGKMTFTPAPKRQFAGLIPTNYAAEKDKWTNEMVNQIPFDPRIRTDLEKERPLEDQFLKK